MDNTERFEKAYMGAPFRLAVVPLVPILNTPMAGAQPCRTLQALQASHNGGKHGVGIAMGAASQVWALMINKQLADGQASLREIEKANAPLPPTWLAENKSGTQYLFFAWTDLLPIENRTSIAPGIDVRGEGSFVAVPPTDGYKWIRSPSQTDLYAPDEWLVKLVTPDRR